VSFFSFFLSPGRFKKVRVPLVDKKTDEQTFVEHWTVDKEYPGQSVMYVAFGTLILWFGWFSFNGGSTVVSDALSIESAANVIVTTSLSACAAGATAAFLAWVQTGEVTVGAATNGILGGLVAITAACDIVSPAKSIVIGMVAGVVFVSSSLLVKMLVIDDVVDAGAIHYFCGLWGVIATGLFSNRNGVIAEGEFSQLGSQLLGALCITAWTFVVCHILFGGLYYISKRGYIDFRRDFAEETRTDNIVMRTSHDFFRKQFEHMVRTSIGSVEKTHGKPSMLQRYMLALGSAGGGAVLTDSASRPVSPRGQRTTVLPKSHNRRPASRRIGVLRRAATSSSLLSISSAGGSTHAKSGRDLHTEFEDQGTRSPTIDHPSMLDEKTDEKTELVVDIDAIQLTQVPSAAPHTENVQSIPSSPVSMSVSVDDPTRRKSPEPLLGHEIATDAKNERLDTPGSSDEYGPSMQSGNVSANSSRPISAELGTVAEAAQLPTVGGVEFVQDMVTNEPMMDIKTSQFRPDEACPLLVQVVSDLHIEMWSQSRFYPKEYLMDSIVIPSAPVLALIGDIGIAATKSGFEDYCEFIRMQSERFELVLLVTGNHEYYSGPEVDHSDPISVDQVHKRIAEFCDSCDNVVFLNRQTIIVNNVRIIGATLWSSIPEMAYELVSKSINDFQFIHVTDEDTGSLRKLTPRDTSAWHEEDVKYIEHECMLAKAAHQHVLVLTHYAPSFDGTSPPQHEGSPLNCAFASSLDHLMSYRGRSHCSTIHTWVFGHTHHIVDKFISGVHVVSK
jgi:Ammonium Transporter Family/Calcineurin-like phosphoesterase